MKISLPILAAALVCLGACSSTSMTGWDIDRMMATHATVPDVKLEGPLGGQRNPVRANGPQGQRDYLARLRCADGLAPSYQRVGSIGIGPYGKMLDGYTVQCRGEDPVTVTMDMYHCVEETRPIPGMELTERVIPIPTFGACPAPSTKTTP